VRRSLACAALACLAACAGERDRFYALSARPEAPQPAASAYTTHVILAVSVPALVDRRQLVLHTADDQVVILEHERWAAPLPELVAQTLARDIEQRRPDVLVADRSFDRADTRTVQVRVDIVEMRALPADGTQARSGGQATIEAHWRIVDAAAKTDAVGGGVFASPLGGEGYAGVARGFSDDLGSLADRLTAALSSH
jgi:uncharacterized lipoprotein YmbA